MAEVKAQLVKELRDRTGAGMMECKRVLLESEGDLERARQLLRERGIIQAGKRAGRATSEGLIVVDVSDDGRRAALCELNCETDFVAKTDEFCALGQQLARLVTEGAAADVDSLLAVNLDGEAVADRVTAAIAKLGENVQVRRVERVEATDNGRIETYVHAGGKIGTLVQIEANDPDRPEVRELAHNLCMHVAAMSPASVSRDDVPAEVIEKERQVLVAQAEQEGKSEDIIDRMVEGRLNKFYREIVLLEQPLVMDPDQTVSKAAQAVGVRVVGFRRFQLGEEIEG